MDEAVHRRAQRPLDGASRRPNVRLSSAEREGLQRNFEPARSLGAEIVTITSGDVARAVVRYVRTDNVGQIIVGIPGRRVIGLP